MPTTQYNAPIGPGRGRDQYSKPIGPEKPKPRIVSDREYKTGMKAFEPSYAEEAAYGGDIIDLDRKPSATSRAISLGKDLLWGKQRAKVIEPARKKQRKGKRQRPGPDGYLPPPDHEPRRKTKFVREGGVRGSFEGLQTVAGHLPRSSFEDVLDMPATDFGFQFGGSPAQSSSPRGKSQKPKKLPNFGFDLGF